ncbi:MAG: bifunctional nuclease family protein [Candidatus Dormibacteria bacterium]
MSELIEVQVDSIRVHMPTSQHVVILKDRSRDRFLPIWIGSYEANAIALRITGITPDRPITHDLMVTILGEMEAVLQQVIVTSLANEVFFARLVFQQGGREFDVDARPSDAIALAVRMEAPIYVSEEVFDRAGVLPESEGEGVEGEEDMSVFREFVNSMDLPDLDNPGRASDS